MGNDEGVVFVDWLADLNEAQREAVMHVDGPLLVVAGAGSGKTRVLTYRIAYLMLEHGVPPYAIMAVTFTNKAAREMRERIKALVGGLAEKVWMGTFHATCVQILRRHADAIGYSRDFLIFDTADQLTVIRECYKELNIDPKHLDPRAVRAEISQAKNERIEPEAYREAATDFRERQIARIYEAYQAKMFEAKALDFDDLLVRTVDLFETAPDVLRSYQDRFRYILIDEYQDTNRVQYLLVKMLAALHRNLCVVGDADQSIYKFRGADIRNILDFERDYPDARVIMLEENYRSTANILEAANAVIENNIDRPKKKLYTKNPPGSLIGLYRALDERDEASFICDEIERLRKEESIELQDVAVLYRTHAQSRALEEELIRRAINYRIVAGLRFYERKEIKDLLAYLRVLANPADVFSLRRIINVPKRGIGDTTLARLEAFAAEQKITLYEAMERADELDDLGPGSVKRVRSFVAMMEEMRSRSKEIGIAGLTEHVLRASGYQRALEEEATVEAETRLENLREFISVAAQFEEENPEADLHAFLEHVALVSDVDVMDDEARAVTLMTLHAAKGLEFPVVFIIGMEEGIFPHSRSMWDAGELEEERRLCYVGMTRAQRRLYLVCARSRRIFGQAMNAVPSRFLDEVPEHLVEDLNERYDQELQEARARLLQRSVTERREPGWSGHPTAAIGERGGLRVIPGGRSSDPTTQANAVEQQKGYFKPGDRIRHPKWGTGTVIQIEQSGPDEVLTLAFPDIGVKKVMAGVVPIEKL